MKARDEARRNALGGRFASLRLCASAACAACTARRRYRHAPLLGLRPGGRGGAGAGPRLRAGASRRQDPGPADSLERGAREAAHRHRGAGHARHAQMGNTWIPEMVTLGAPRAGRAFPASPTAATSPGSWPPTSSTTRSSASPGTWTPGCCSTARTSWPARVMPRCRRPGTAGARRCSPSSGPGAGGATRSSCPINEWPPHGHPRPPGRVAPGHRGRASAPSASRPLPARSSFCSRSTGTASRRR